MLDTENEGNTFAIFCLFIACVAIILSSCINDSAKKEATQCIDKGGQWVQVTVKTFTCVMPK